MSVGAAVATDAIGAAMVLITLRDMVHELFHPGGSGSLSRALQRSVWRVFRVAGPRRRGTLVMAGPTALLVVLGAWTVLLALGWAFVFLPYLPQEFRFAAPLSAASQRGFGAALYTSLVALTTLGYGDITPTEPVLRVLVTLEAGIGVGLFSAGISWILSIYPVLGRRRTLAQRVFLLHASCERTHSRVPELDAVVAAGVLGELSAALARVNVDLVQSGITYYFADRRRELALAAVVPYLTRLADDGSTPERDPAVRHAAAALHEAVLAYADTVRTEYLHIPERPLDEVLARYAADHFEAPLAYP